MPYIVYNIDGEEEDFNKQSSALSLIAGGTHYKSPEAAEKAKAKRIEDEKEAPKKAAKARADQEKRNKTNKKPRSIVKKKTEGGA